MNIETPPLEKAPVTLQEYTDYFKEQLRKLDLENLDHGITKEDSGLDVTQIPFSLDTIDDLIKNFPEDVAMSPEEITAINIQVQELHNAKNKFNETTITVTEKMRNLAKAIPERNFAENFETSFRILVDELSDPDSKYKDALNNPELLPLMEDLKCALEEFEGVKNTLQSSKETYLSLHKMLDKSVLNTDSSNVSQSGIHDPERVQATELKPIDGLAAKGLRSDKE